MKLKFMNSCPISVFLIATLMMTLCIFSGCQSSSEVDSEQAMHSEQVNTPAQFDDMYVFGEAENVTVVSEGFTYKARLDTGATTTSIHAVDISQFNRDGKKWVRFSLVDPKTEETKQLERSLSRIVSIKRHGADDQKRPVVMLNLKMGPVEKACEVSLTDRSQFEYPVLVGRNFLSGDAIVDVSRIYTDGLEVEGD